MALLAAILAVFSTSQALGETFFEAAIAALIAASAGYLLWQATPAYALSLGLFASVFSGNWSAIGLPAEVPPDRILETVGILLVLLRAPGTCGRRLRVERIHWLMGLTIVYVLINAWATDGHVAAAFQLLDAFGLYPFLFFLVAPVAFQTSHDRNILLTAVVCLGAYLGLTAMMEALHVNALVFPKYILNPLYGDPSTAGRVRGPFAAAVQMGFGLYGCAVVSALAAATWRRHSAKGIAGAVAVLCLFGTLLTEQRSVWLGATVATIAVLLITPKLRAWTLPVIVLGALAVLGAFAVIPDLSHNTASRFASSEPVWSGST